MTDIPILRLKPKANAQRIRFGAPWVYADDLVLDRRSKNLPAGTIAELQDKDRTPLATVAVNTGSKIAARVLDKPNVQIDRAWFAAKIGAALAHRARLYDAPFYRLIHAEGDGLPGVIIDRFGDTAVVQPNAAYSDVMIADLAGALADVTGVAHIYKNASGRTRGLEGLDDQSEWLLGGQDAPLPVGMNGATYLAVVTGGQKTGLFFDQRENHRFAASLAEGQDVLDVFSHVGGFGLAMLAGGAVRATAVDASLPALTLAAQGAEAMGREADLETIKGDAFKMMETLVEDGRQFGVVICDPPAFAPSKPARDAGLRAYERIARLGARLVAPNGYLGLCSCSHAADLTAFRTASLRGIGRAGRVGQVIHTGAAGPDHPTHPYLAENDYLKSIFLRLVG